MWLLRAGKALTPAASIGGLVAAIDGAFLGGIAAIITAIGGLIGLVLGYRQAQRSVAAAGSSETVAEWRAIALEREREIRRLRRELDRARRTAGA